MKTPKLIIILAALILFTIVIGVLGDEPLTFRYWIMCLLGTLPDISKLVVFNWVLDKIFPIRKPVNEEVNL